VNCNKDVGSDEAKFFAQVFVCPTCYEIAERLFVKGEQELKMMLVMLKECIRLAIIKKELQFSVQNVEDMPRKDLFTELATLAQEARQEAIKNQPPQEELVEWKRTQTSSIPTTTPLLETSKQPAAGKTVDGPASSSSNSDQD
jgi:hypothetical protein